MNEKDRKMLCRVIGDLGLRQADLAEKTGIHRSTLSLWENGKLALSDKKLLKISRAIGEVMKERAEAQTLPYPQVAGQQLAKACASRRREWGITQAELAGRADLASDTISLWENGYAKLDGDEEDRIVEELEKIVEKRRANLKLPPENHFEAVRKNQREIIEELTSEVSRLELLNRELSESKDREIEALREQLKESKRERYMRIGNKHERKPSVTIPPEE